MIRPFLQDEAFLNDVQGAQHEPDQLHLWWLGQSGFLLQYEGHHLMIDPYLSDSLTKKYAGTSKPHVRVTERVVAPEILDFIDVVTSSHNHTDHLDGETLIPLLRVNPDLKVLLSRANLDFAAERLQASRDRLTGLHVDAPVNIGPFTFIAIPSAHESLEQDEAGDHRFIGLIIRVGPWTIYHSGDCILYEGLAERLLPWKPDLALLPINGRDPARGVAGNFSAEEAVRLGQDAHIDQVIPCHYEMFEFNSVSPEGFVSAAQAAGQGYRVLQCGERFSLSPGNEAG